MQIETRFNLGDKVRVVRDGGFIGTVTAIHVEIKEHDSRLWYSVTLPEEKRGSGRNYTEEWGYSESWLEAV